MEIRWTPEATSNLEQISLRIARDNPEAALRTVTIVFERIERLVTFPHGGRVRRDTGTRELVLALLPCIAVYRVMESTIEILHIRHGAQYRN